MAGQRAGQQQARNQCLIIAMAMTSSNSSMRIPKGNTLEFPRRLQVTSCRWNPCWSPHERKTIRKSAKISGNGSALSNSTCFGHPTTDSWWKCNFLSSFRVSMRWSVPQIFKQHKLSLPCRKPRSYSEVRKRRSPCWPGASSSWDQWPAESNTCSPASS